MCQTNMTIKLFFFFLSAFVFTCLPCDLFSQSQVPFRKSETMGTVNQLPFLNDVNHNRHPNDGQLESLISLHDSAYFWDWDPLNSTWSPLPYARDINITYDLNYRLTGFLHQNNTGNTWTNDYKIIDTNDSTGNVINEVKLIWDGSGWQNDWQSSNTYDIRNNMLSSLSQTWDSAWINNKKFDYAYDLNDNMVSQIDSNWNDTAWEIASFHTLVYDTNNNMISRLYQVSLFGAPLENYFLYTYTYDTSNKCTSLILQNWDGNVWLNSRKSIYNYDLNQDMTYETLEIWDGSSWINGIRSFFTYNSNHSRTNRLNQGWNGNSWKNVDRYGYTYGADNFNQSYANQHWNQDGTSIDSGDSIYIFYHTVIGIDELAPVENASLIIYPNPASSEFTIQSSTSFPAQLEIYNQIGEKMYVKIIDREPLSVNCEFFPAGIYFVKLISSKENFIGKIIIQ